MMCQLVIGQEFSLSTIIIFFSYSPSQKLLRPTFNTNTANYYTTDHKKKKKITILGNSYNQPHRPPPITGETYWHCQSKTLQPPNPFTPPNPPITDQTHLHYRTHQYRQNPFASPKPNLSTTKPICTTNPTSQTHSHH